MDIRKGDLFLVGGSALVFFIAAGLGWWFWGERAIPLVAGLGLFLVLAVQLELYRRLQRVLGQSLNEQRYRLEKKHRKDYEQIEALFSLFSQLKLQAPLPAMRSWAASPDLLRTLLNLIQEQQPRQIVEAGCGVSTLVCAYCLRDLGRGSVLTLEHQEEYAARCRQELLRHGLQDYATVVHAPLRELHIGGEKRLWYDLDKLTGVPAIDLLVVDGPTQAGTWARYPALPLLQDRLADSAVILLDDGEREDEKKIVARWLHEIPGLTAEYLPLEKGAFVLHRHREHKELRKAG